MQVVRIPLGACYKSLLLLFLLSIYIYIYIYKIKIYCVRSEAIMAVTMKNGVFWDVTPCGSCKNRRFGET
jgi:hypothetical protein